MNDKMFRRWINHEYPSGVAYGKELPEAAHMKMTPYLNILNRMLEPFRHINNAVDFVSLLAPISLTEITSDGDRMDESLAPIPIRIHCFSFKDLEERTAELELGLSKETGDLVNARVQTFFADTNKRNNYWEGYIEPFFPLEFQRVNYPEYPGIPIREYRINGLAVGVNLEAELPFISTHVTLEGPPL